jgi:hypothetical protein
LRGLLEVYRETRADDLLSSASACAAALAEVTRADGFVPGRLDSLWGAAAPWACLTGSAQIVACWLLLDELRGERRYAEVAARVNAYVRRTIDVNVRGAVKGSFPVSGDYGRFEYPNWACKFAVDANVIELGGWQAVQRV